MSFTASYARGNPQHPSEGIWHKCPLLKYPLFYRYAVAKATKRDSAAVTKCRDVVEGLMGEFLQVRGRATLSAFVNTRHAQ